MGAFGGLMTLITARNIFWWVGVQLVGETFLSEAGWELAERQSWGRGTERGDWVGGRLAAGPLNSELCLWLQSFDHLPGKPGRSDQAAAKPWNEEPSQWSGQHYVTALSSHPGGSNPICSSILWSSFCIGLLLNWGL